MDTELREIPYELRGRRFTGCLADGSKGRRVPGILVVHEGRGLTKHPKDRASMLADLGYVAFAADYFGETVTSPEQFQQHLAPYRADPGLFREHGKAALDVLRAQPSVDGNRLAAIGFCFGGSAVLELARAGADVRCVVGFHPGLSLGRPRDRANISAKVLICLGDQDPFVPAKDRDAFIAEMSAAGVDCQMLLMVGVQHSFTNPDADTAGVEGAKYDAVADRRSWNAMRTLFAETLG